MHRIGPALPTDAPPLDIDLALAECGVPLEVDCTLDFGLDCDLGWKPEYDLLVDLNPQTVDVETAVVDVNIDWEKELADFDWSVAV